MGLFDGIKMMKDLVVDGIAAVKASDEVEELAQKAASEYDDVLTDDNKQLYAKFRELCDKRDDTEDVDESNSYGEEAEKAAVAFLLAVSANAAVPQEFNAEAAAAIAELQKANDAPIEHFNDYLMGMAKDDEEREVVRQIIEEAEREE